MERILNNTLRGNRVLLWMKALFVIAVLATILGYGLWYALGSRMVQSMNVPVSIGVWAIFLLFLLGCFLLLIVFGCTLVFWILWWYRALRNVKEMDAKGIPAFLGVLLCLVPYVGQIIHYFIFRNLVNRIRKELDSRGIVCRRVPVKLLNVFLLMNIGGCLFFFVDGLQEFSGVSAFFGFVALGCYIRVLEIFVLQERSLYKAVEDEVLNRKVEAVLREREIQKAAEKVQAATYESEPSSSSGV